MRQSIETRVDERATRAPVASIPAIRDAHDRRFEVRLRPTFIRRSRAGFATG
jgi:hypothetical protein